MQKLTLLNRSRLTEEHITALLTVVLIIMVHVVVDSEVILLPKEVG